VFLGYFSGLGNGSSNVSTFSDADANTTFVVAHNDEGAETEAATALYNASYAVNVDNTLVELFLFFNNWASVTTATRWTAFGFWLCMCCNFSHG
jgi:hypothetical protein